MVDLTGWPTDAGGGSVSTEARWRTMARLWAPSGVVDGYLNQLAPSHAGGNVTVQTGGAWVDGHYCEQLSSQAVAVASSGLVVIRFTPADNRFQLLWLNGASNPTQTTATWELPIAQMTGGTMSDVRVFVSAASTTTAMIKNEAVTPAKMSPGSVAAFIESGGSVEDLALTLTGSFQPTASITFTKPAAWATYEITVWGAAAVRSDAVKATPTGVGIRASAGGNNGTARGALVGGGFDLEVSARAKFTGLFGATQLCSIDIQKTTPDSATVQAAHVSYQAIRTT